MKKTFMSVAVLAGCVAVSNAEEAVKVVTDAANTAATTVSTTATDANKSADQMGKKMGHMKNKTHMKAKGQMKEMKNKGMEMKSTATEAVDSSMAPVVAPAPTAAPMTSVTTPAAPAMEKK